MATSNPYDWAASGQADNPSAGMGTDMGMNRSGAAQYTDWKPGPGATTTQNTSPTAGLKPVGGTPNYANPDPQGQPWVDYINPDGTPHINPRYGQNSGGSRSSSGEGMVDPRYGYDGGNRGAPGGGSNAYGDPNAQWYAQFDQNRNQYNQDFGEAQRRWDAQFGREGAQNQWQQDFSNRQQTAAEWQQQEAARQWAQQFGYQQGQDRWNQQYQQQQADRQYGMQGRELSANTDRWNSDRQLQYQQMAQQQQQALRELTANTGRWDADRLQQHQQFADQMLFNRDEMNAKDAYQRYQLEQQMGQQGRELDANVARWNADRGLQSQEMNQRDALTRWQMGQQMGFNREELGATQQWRGQQDALARYQLEQQMGMQGRELAANQERWAADRAAQERLAAIQAYGRNQAPQARFIRNF